MHDGIALEPCHVQLASVDDAIQHVVLLGHQSQMAKIDVAHAYRNIPVHPQDRWLLEMQWEERVYIDTVLPFGVRSALKIFCALSDALEWALNRQQVNHVVKYIDDFLIVGPPRSDQCARDLVTTIETCEELGLPLSLEKREGPTTLIEFLGIELGTELMKAKELHH